MVANAARRLSKETQSKLVRLAQSIQQKQNEYSEFRDKLEDIDLAYAKQKISIANNDADCTSSASTEEVIKVPIVASEVDTVAAELVRSFVDPDNLFGVLSDRGNPEAAMAFQSLLSRDARQQRWGRQITLFCNNAARYNVAGIEADKIWQKDNELINDAETTNAEFEQILRPVTALKAIDMYNALFDYRVPPADVATDGEYVGYNELYTRTRLKMLGNLLTEKDYVYNAKEAYDSNMGTAVNYWNERPDISTISPVGIDDTQNWLNWVGIVDDKDKIKMQSDTYLLTKLYVRIIPSEFGISSSAKPIIIQLRIVNNEHLFSYKEIITPLDVLPILLCDLREDGFGYQTHSVGEAVKPYQDVTTELLDTRLEGSKRALSDRAIYDDEYLDSNMVNQRITTAKIPLRSKLKNSGDRPPLNQLYYPIPYDSSATIQAMQDMSTLLSIKDEVNGVNFARRGEQRPGNRTLGEFETLAASSSGRTLPYNIRIEEQVMILLKAIIKAYTLSVNEGIQDVFDPNQERVIQANMAQLRSAMLEYRVTGGTRKKQLLRNPEVLSMAFQAVQNSQELNVQYNTAGIFADLMAVLDIDISKHKREVPVNAAQSVNPDAGVPSGNPEQGGEGTN